MTIPRTSQEQWKLLPHVPASKVLPGDLVFFAGADGTVQAPGHVGLVVGKHTMIEAYATGHRRSASPSSARRSRRRATPWSSGYARPWSNKDANT